MIRRYIVASFFCIVTLAALIYIFQWQIAFMFSLKSPGWVILAWILFGGSAAYLQLALVPLYEYSYRVVIKRSFIMIISTVMAITFAVFALVSIWTTPETYSKPEILKGIICTIVSIQIIWNIMFSALKSLGLDHLS